MKGSRPTPLEPYMCGFHDYLSTQGYSENRLALHVRHMAHLGRWLDEQGVDLGNFNLTHVEAFLVERRAAYRYLSGVSLRGLTPLLAYLGWIDVLPQPPPSPPATPIEFLLNDFVDYLRSERGLAEETIAHYRYTAARFLAERVFDPDVADGVGSLAHYEGGDFLRSQADRLNVGSLRQSVAALR